MLPGNNNYEADEDPTDAFADEGDAVSKSARKREAQRLRDLGAQLTQLSSERLAKLALPEALHKAVSDHQRFRSHGAKRRQLQLIGGILRKVDAGGVEQALAELNGEAANARYQLHQAERWRDALLTDTNALTQYLDEHQDLDRQQLRNLVQRGQRATNFGKALDSPQAKAASRALFRFLRDSQVE